MKKHKKTKILLKEARDLLLLMKLIYKSEQASDMVYRIDKYFITGKIEQ